MITDIDFKLACESTCFSMMDCIDNIISLCFTEAGIDNEIKFDFGEEFNVILNRLKENSLELIELEDIKIDEEAIVDDVLDRLGGDDSEDESDISDVDDIF